MKFNILVITAILFVHMVSAQVAVNTDNSAPDPAAMLDVKSSIKGFLPPRMSSAQVNSIVSPPEGLTVYNTTLKSLCWFDGSTWVASNRDGKSCGSVNFSGQTYNGVIIGTQCWMTANLNLGTMISSTQNQANNGIFEKYCYNNDTNYCNIYGGLYQWDEVMNYTSSGSGNQSGRQGICPPAWHIPSDAELTQLSVYLGGDALAGGALKETGTTHWFSPNTGALNSFGFTGLPSGGVYTGSGFMYIAMAGNFWSATENGSLASWSRVLVFNSAQFGRSSNPKSDAKPVRCCKD